MVDGTPLMAEVDADDRVGVGDHVRLHVDPARLHAFDPETERALW